MKTVSVALNQKLYAKLTLMAEKAAVRLTNALNLPSANMLTTMKTFTKPTSIRSILLNVLSFYLLANRFLSIIFDADLKPARETMPCPKKSA